MSEQVDRGHARTHLVELTRRLLQLHGQLITLPADLSGSPLDLSLDLTLDHALVLNDLLSVEIRLTALVGEPQTLLLELFALTFFLRGGGSSEIA